MKNNSINTLLGEIDKTQKIIKKIDTFYLDFIDKNKEKSVANAIVVAESFVNFYTCLETLFLKISQHFENNLKSHKWHSDLLRKMTLRIEDIRDPVLSDETYNILLEFLRFRHFNRHYFEFDYDWDRLEFLKIKYEKAKPMFKTDIDNFITFLNLLNIDF